MKHKIIFIFILVITIPLYTNADTIYLIDGRELKADAVWEKGEFIEYKYLDGTIRIPEHKVLSIERTGGSEWDEKILIAQLGEGASAAFGDSVGYKKVAQGQSFFIDKKCTLKKIRILLDAEGDPRHKPSQRDKIVCDLRTVKGKVIASTSTNGFSKGKRWITFNFYKKLDKGTYIFTSYVINSYNKEIHQYGIHANPNQNSYLQGCRYSSVGGKHENWSTWKARAWDLKFQIIVSDYETKTVESNLDEKEIISQPSGTPNYIIGDDGKYFKFDKWVSGMTMWEVVNIAKKNKISLTILAKNSGYLVDILKDEPLERLIKERQQFFYGDKLMGENISVYMYFTPISKKLYAISAAFKTTDSDFRKNIKSILEKKYGKITKTRNTENSIIFDWIKNNGISIILNNAKNSTVVVYNDEKINSLGTKEHILAREKKLKEIERDSKKF